MGIACKICDGLTGAEYIAREMMVGKREEFTYWECLDCGCLQIASIPDRLGDYYPNDYYSFSTRIRPLRALADRLYFKAPALLRPFLQGRDAAYSWVVYAKRKRGARILDVGCGVGKLVAILRGIGLDAHGIDPFLEKETPYLRRSNLDRTDDGWDLIMFHHSLEHIPDNVTVLGHARERLNSGGRCLVRIPLAAWAWQHYRVDWVQLDAPRHLVIHSLESFRRASKLAGFEILDTVFDSGAFQFYASELYRRNVPLKDQHSVNKWFDRGEMRSFEIRAANLNRQQLGDQACFYLGQL
jgi:SAM-dependent methyltransferase